MASMKLSRQNMPSAVHAANALRPFRLQGWNGHRPFTPSLMHWAAQSRITRCHCGTFNFAALLLSEILSGQPNLRTQWSLLRNIIAHLHFCMCPSEVLRETSTANRSSQRQAVAMQKVNKLMPKDATHFYAFRGKNRPPTFSRLIHYSYFTPQLY